MLLLETSGLKRYFDSFSACRESVKRLAPCRTKTRVRFPVGEELPSSSLRIKKAIGSVSIGKCFT
jgi:hypothetical protein